MCVSFNKLWHKCPEVTGTQIFLISQHIFDKFMIDITEITAFNKLKLQSNFEYVRQLIWKFEALRVVFKNINLGFQSTIKLIYKLQNIQSVSVNIVLICTSDRKSRDGGVIKIVSQILWYSDHRCIYIHWHNIDENFFCFRSTGDWNHVSVFHVRDDFHISDLPAPQRDGEATSKESPERSLQLRR